MEDALHARIDLISDAVMVEGSDEAIARVERIFQDYEALRRQGILLQNGELNGMLRLVTADPSVSLRTLPKAASSALPASSAWSSRVRSTSAITSKPSSRPTWSSASAPPARARPISPSPWLRAALLAKKISRIVLVRPAVEAGERLGFLPGTLQEKVDPYLRPLYDALYDLLEPDRVDKMLERNVIEVAPLAFMRGRTLNDCFIIMDEAAKHHQRADEDVPHPHGQQRQSRHHRRHHPDRSAQPAEIRPG